MTSSKTTIAYRCPECGSSVKSVPGALNLSADMLRIKCPCGGSELTLAFVPGGKISLSVPCFSCPRPHNYTISQKLFFGGKLLKIPCQLSGSEICFIGSEEETDAAISEQEATIREGLGEHDFSEVTESRGKDTYLDPQILDMLMYTVKELNDEEAITCHCARGEGEYEVTVTEKGILVTCKNCDASKEIIAGSLSEAQAFLESDVLNLN